MKAIWVSTLALVGLMMFVSPTLAAEQTSAGADVSDEVDQDVPRVRLQALLTEVAAKSGKEFLVHAEAEQTLYAGGTPLDDPGYPVLLSVLRNNDLAGVEIEGRVHIVPAAIVRQLPLPVVQRDDADIPDEEWVTRVITLEQDVAPHLVPILRPLLPREGHMAALPPNKLLIVDRYANVRRIAELIDELTR